MKIPVQNQETLLEELESQQFASLYQFDDAPLIDPAGRYLHRWLYFFVGLAAVAVALGFLVKYPEKLDIPFVVNVERPPHIYTFRQPLFVEEMRVKPGQKVTKGDTLCKISSHEIAAHIAQFTRLEWRNAQLQSGEQREVSEKNKVFDLQATNSERRIASNRTALQALDQSWAEQNLEYYRNLELAEANLTRIKALFKEGVTAQAELEKAEGERQQQVLQHLAAKNQYLASQNAILLELASLTETPERYRQEKTVQQTSLSNELDDNQQQLQSIKALLSAEYGAYAISGASIYLLAESDGELTYTFENNQELQAGEFLIKIKTPTQAFRIAAKASSAQIGRIANGQKVVLKLHSFPFFEYGTISALVENCASSPDAKGFYPIALNITAFGLLKDRLQDGLTGDAVVFLKEKSFFGHLSSKINRRSIFHVLD